jgi:hypothetical protein
MEEKFIFTYHLKWSLEDYWDLLPWERRWYIDRFVEQKNKEHESMESAKKKNRRH